MSFPRELTLCEIQTALSRILTQTWTFIDEVNPIETNPQYAHVCLLDLQEITA